MTDDRDDPYLWDRSGAEDPDVARLEALLRPLRHGGALPPLPARLIHPHEVVAIEDSPAGLESAAGAGLRTLGVAHTYPLERLEATAKVPALAGLTLEEIEELMAGAD